MWLSFGRERALIDWNLPDLALLSVTARECVLRRRCRYNATNSLARDDNSLFRTFAEGSFAAR
jgi:hypothetical protein